jgi:lysophosphatidylcholine acyltransferase/lyso-PAF acetyltransferase
VRGAAGWACALARWPLQLARLLATGAVLTLAWLLALLGTAGLSATAAEAPLPLWRRVVTAPVRLHVARALAWLLGYLHIEVRGELAPRAAAPIVVANHISLVEPVVLLALTGGMPVSAAENRSLPLIGAPLVALQALFVQRDRSGGGGGSSAGGGASATVAAASTSAADEGAPPPPGADINAKIAHRARCDAYPRLLIFPEGTTTNGRALLSFRSGAFRPGLPVQPVVVAYPRAGADPAWVSDGPNGMAVAMALWAQPRSRVAVTFLPVYTPSAAERADAELYAANVQRVMAAALDVPTTQYTYEDIQLTLEAVRAGYPVDDVIVQFEEVRARRGTLAAAAQPACLQRL